MRAQLQTKRSGARPAKRKGGGSNRPYERLLTLAGELVVALESSWERAVSAAHMRDFQPSNACIATDEAERSAAGQEEGGRF